MTMVSSAVEAVGEYRIETAHGVADIDRDAWNRVVLDGGGSVFHAWEWLAAFEEAPPGIFEPAHLLAYQDDDLVGICPAYLVHQCPRLDYLASLAGIQLGGPILLAHSFAAFAGGPIALAHHGCAVDALVDAMEEQARILGAWAWGFANVPGRSLIGRLLGNGYAVSQLATTYLVDAGYDSPDRFWHSIDPRRRRKFERDRRLAQSRGFTVHEGTPDVDTFVRLVHALLAARDTPVDVLPGDFLRALRSRLAPFDRTVTTTNADGETVALFACWEFGTECSVWLAGLDTTRLSAFEPYHPMMAQAVDNAVVHGTRTVNLGRANGSHIRRYGALPTPLFLALRSADGRRNAQLHAACVKLETQIQGGTEGLDAVRRCC
jgi:predicted N-acyltransferase